MADGTIAERLEPTPTALYRHFDASGNLLYVGISLSPTYRLSQHRDASKWFDRISEIKIEWCPTRPDALKAERLAIQTERPECNIVHRNTRDARAAYLEEMAEESAAELVRKVARYKPTYTMQEAGKTIGVGTGVIRRAIEVGELTHFMSGKRPIITGWALIAYLEALEAGVVHIRPRPASDETIP